MKFGEIPVEQAAGALLAHSLRLDRQTLRKGRRLTAEDIAAIAAVGRHTIIAAQLDADDIGEDESAAQLAAAACGEHLTVSAAFTGRCNLFASAHGLAVVDAERIDRLNLVDEAVTIATLPPFAPVEPRQMVATIKIIPFAVAAAVVARCAAIARDGGPLVKVAPFRRKAVGLIQTKLPGTKPGVLASTIATTRARLAALGSELSAETICEHDQGALQAAVAELRRAACDPILILGASAIVDRRDVVPAAIVAQGGEVIHFGMPVDPGNLLLLGRLGETPVIGLLGCARSPKLNGFDWVMQRLLADLPVTRSDVMRMGAGGLLMEIASRPLPRGEAAPDPSLVLPRAPRIVAVVLAAGRSTRLAPVNKLLAELDGRPMVARVVEAALSSQAGPVIVVTGHQASELRRALQDLPVTIVDNPDHAAGLSTSIKVGLAAVPGEADGALFLLGDMPRVAPTHIDRLIAAFSPADGRAICVPTFRAKRGNPVLWSSRFFAEMAAIEGDTGARALLTSHADHVCEVEMADDAVVADVDTPEALAALRSAGERESARPKAG